MGIKSKFHQRLESALQKNEEMIAKKEKSKFQQRMEDAINQESTQSVEDYINGKKKDQSDKENLKKAFVAGSAMGYHNEEEAERLFNQWYKNNIDL